MRLLPAFLLAFFVSIFSHAFWPEFPLMCFSPFLALVCLRLPLLKSLWLTLFASLSLDLLSSGERLGFYLIPYMFSILLLHRHKKHFFEEQLISFALYTAIISSFTTLWMTLFSLVNGPKLSWSWQFFAVDLLLLPCMDGLMGFFLFILPYRAFRLLKKTPHWRIGFLRMRKS